MQPPRADTSALPPIVVIGPGRVGTAIARGGRAAGLEVTLAGREDAIAACRGAELILLCVPDAEIPVAARAAIESAAGLRMLGHTSGATGLDALDHPERGDSRHAGFSLHPLQTVPEETAELTGAPAAVAASDAETLALARSLASALGMSPFDLPEESRAAYHAAASIASNFLVTLEESATELLATTGVENPRELLAPLVLRSAANWAERGSEALTGPIARGDEATVERHLAALVGTSPELEPLYRALADRTRELARTGSAAVGT